MHGPAIERLDVVKTSGSTKHGSGEMWLTGLVLATI